MEEPAQEDNDYTVHYGILAKRVETIEQDNLKTAIIHEIEKTHTHIHSVAKQLNTRIDSLETSVNTRIDSLETRCFLQHT